MGTILTYLFLGCIGFGALYGEIKQKKGNDNLKKKISRMLLEELQQQTYRG